MARLRYIAITSLDGYVADREGDFSWSMPDQEVHAFVNDLDRPLGTQLYGRRLFEVLQVWEEMPTGPDEPPEIADFAEVWRAADKVVFSRTLSAVHTTNTRLMRELDPEWLRRLKETATADIGIGGPELAGQAIRAGLVDDVHLLISPVLVGGGTPALPDDVRRDLELVEHRSFGNGVIALHYRAR